MPDSLTPPTKLPDLIPLVFAAVSVVGNRPITSDRTVRERLTFGEVNLEGNHFYEFMDRIVREGWIDVRRGVSASVGGPADRVHYSITEAGINACLSTLDFYMRWAQSK